MAGNRVTVGDVEIISLSDGSLAFDLCNFFPDILEGKLAAISKPPDPRTASSVQSGLLSGPLRR